jgi:hypothetical protein
MDAGGRGGARGFGGTGGAGQAGGSQGGGGRGNGQGGARVVFVKTPEGFTPRLVRLGVSNYDVAQVLSGLREGEQVALLSAAQLQYQRQENVARIRQRMGNGLPGSAGGGTGGQRGGGGGSRPPGGGM